jgi:hypothetical protein
MGRCAAVLGSGLLIGLLGALRADAPPTAQPVDSQQIEKLVEQLASPRFAERERARQQLRQIGEPALEALRRALQSSDAEQRRRAAELVREIEDRQLQTRLLAPKRVRLDLEDRSVAEAVQELARQSGYSLQLLDPQNTLSKHKITLHTGEVSFWEALDQLCQKAGLVEEFFPRLPVGVRPLPVQPVPPIRVRPLPVQPAQPVPVPPPPKAGVQAVPAAPGSVERSAPATPAPASAPPGSTSQKRKPVEETEKAPMPPVLPVPLLPAQPDVQQVIALRLQAVAQAAQQAGRARVIAPGLLNNSSTTLTLKPGTPSSTPTCYAGAIRIRALPLPAGVQLPPGEQQVFLEVLAEPRVPLLAISGIPQVQRAVDDQGQRWTAVADGAPAAGIARPLVYHRLANAFTRLTATVRLQAPANAQPARTLKELVGTLPLQVLGPVEPLLRVDRPQQAVGKTISGATGGSLEIVSFRKQDNGDYQVELRLQNLSVGTGPVVIRQVLPQPAGGPAQVQIITASASNDPSQLPVLRDAQGRAYQLVQVPRRSTRVLNGATQEELVLVFRPQPGQGEPASLALEAPRLVTLSIPFRLENIPLR